MGLLALVCVLICLNLPDIILCLYACFVLLIILKYLWTPYQPAVFLFGLVFQWTQSALRIFQANFAGEKLDIFDRSANASIAAYAALSSTLIVSLVLAWFVRMNKWDKTYLLNTLTSVNIKRVFGLHIIMFIGMPLLSLAKIGGLSQIIVSLESLKWLGYCLLVMSVVVQRRLYLLLGISFISELILGFTGYFSSFKNVVFFSLISILSLTPRVTPGRVIISTVLGVFVIALGLFWTSIKGDYRKFLSGGQRAQIVTVSATESLEYVYSSFSTVRNTPVEITLEAFLNRLQYTKMIQLVMDYIPRHFDHQQGKQWQDAIRHIFQPRLLFPDKPPLDDSAITSKYTGLRWAGADEGTSISIGYVAESYVDYGIPQMFIPVAILALLVGLLYRNITRQPQKYALLFYVTSIVLFIRFSHIETSYTKIIGGLITTFLVYILIIKTAVFPFLWNFISRKR